MSGFDNEVVYANNWDFRGVQPVLAQVTVAGQLPIGTGAAPAIEVGSITSPLGTITIGYSSPNITMDVDGGSVGQTITGNLGTPLSPVAGNWNLFGTATNGIETDSTGPNFIISMNSPYADGDFSFESQVGGATRTLTVQNTVDAASSQATNLVKVAGGTSGDVWTQYSIGSTQSYAMGIDNSDNDNFKIMSNASGTVSPSSGTEIARYDLGLTVASWIFGGGTPSASPGGMGLVRNDQTNAASMGIENLASAGGVSGTNGAGLTIRVNTAGGDTLLTHSTGTTVYTSGIDNADSDIWKMSNVGRPSLGTTLMSVTSVGEVRFPVTPAFLATANAQANVTGNNTQYTVLFANEIFDQNSDFSSPNFTAPVTGRYQLQASVGMTDLAAVASTTGNIQLITSNRNYTLYVINPTAVRDLTSNALTLGGTVLADMDAGDTAQVRVQYAGGGADNNDVIAFPNTYFSGKLAC